VYLLEHIKIIVLSCEHRDIAQMHLSKNNTELRSRNVLNSFQNDYKSSPNSQWLGATRK
jgi:hypothetical protein